MSTSSNEKETVTDPEAGSEAATTVADDQHSIEYEPNDASVAKWLSRRTKCVGISALILILVVVMAAVLGSVRPFQSSSSASPSFGVPQVAPTSDPPKEQPGDVPGTPEETVVQTRWPQLVQQPVDVAVATIQRDRPDVTVQVLHVDSMYTSDYDTSRVRVFFEVNKDNAKVVAREPRVG